MRVKVMWCLASGLRSEWSGREVHGESFAPDGDRAVLAEVEVGRHVIVLIAIGTLELAELDETGALDGGVVAGIVGRDQVDPNIGTVRGGELGQPDDAASVCQPDDSMRCPGSRGRPSGTCRSPALLPAWRMRSSTRWFAPRRPADPR